MIDITSEQLIPLTQAPATFPVRPSICTIWRWRTKGVRGRKLEAVIIGGRVYTSIEALARFAQQRGGPEPSTFRTPRQRERAIAQAERELEREGT